MIVLDETKLEAVKKGFHIPSKPEILTQISEEMEKEEVSLDNVAAIISKDISLSALLLKTINSPLFGLQRTIGDIRQAAMFLGLDQLSRLVTVALLKQKFAGEACISLERFWDESLEVATACMFFGDKYKSQVAMDELYALGLFHNVGIAAMAIRFDDYVEALAEANNVFDRSITDLEQKRYHTDHAVIGYYVSTSWHLPKDLCNVILHHHDTTFLNDCSDEKSRIAFAILKCAESASEYSRRQQYSNDWFHVREPCFTELGIVDQDFQDMVEDFIENYSVT